MRREERDSSRDDRWYKGPERRDDPQAMVKAAMAIGDTSGMPTGRERFERRYGRNWTPAGGVSPVRSKPTTGKPNDDKPSGRGFKPLHDLGK